MVAWARKERKGNSLDEGQGHLRALTVREKLKGRTLGP